MTVQSFASQMTFIAVTVLFALRASAEPIGARPETVLQCDEQVIAAGFVDDGKSLVTVDDDGRIVVWDLKSGKRKKEIAPVAARSIAAFSPDGKMIGLARHGNVELWDIALGKKSAEFSFDDKPPSRPVTALAFSRNGAWLAAAGFLGDLRVWEVRTGFDQIQCDSGLADVTSLDFNDKDELSVVGKGTANAGGYNRIRVEAKKLVSGGKTYDTLSTCVKLAPKWAPYSVIGYSDGALIVEFWSVGGDLKVMSDCKPVRAIATAPWSVPNDAVFAIAGGTSEIELRRYVGSGFFSKDRLDRISSLKAHEAEVLSLAFSADGRLASGGKDKKAIVWKIPAPDEWQRKQDEIRRLEQEVEDLKKAKGQK